MYGSIAKFTLKPGGLDAIRRIAESTTEYPPGAIAEYVFQMDDDPNEVWLAVIFEDEETYRANAERPEQHAKFEQIAQWFAADPEWHDGEIVYSLHAQAHSEPKPA